MSEKVPHSVMHVGRHLLQEHDGPVGAALGAVMVPVVAASVFALSAPVAIGLAAIGAFAGWDGAWKKNK